MICHFPGFHPYMYMQSKDQIAAGCFLQFIYDLIVAGMISDQLAFPVTKRMRARRTHSEAKSSSYFGDRLSQLRYILISLINISAYVGAYLNYRLVHFSLHFILDHFLSFMHNFLFVT